jgi:hypothetical protein
MEIHRPKLFHGGRELAKEVGIIVIGVLIALGGEEMVRGLNQRFEVAQARRALRSEIAQNAEVAGYNVEEERCAVALWGRLVAWAKGGPRVQIKDANGLFPQATSTWEVVKTGAAAHMPLHERLAYSQFYDRVESQRWVTEQERTASVRLVSQLQTAARTPADVQRFLEDGAQVQILGRIHGLNSSGIVRAAKAMGIDPMPMPAPDRELLTSRCADAGIALAPPMS